MIMNFLKQNDKSQKNEGLTLVETLITLGFASLLILALVSLTSFNVRNSLLVTENQDAINSANKLLEDIRNVKDTEFARIHNNTFNCNVLTNFCSIDSNTNQVKTLTASEINNSNAPISYFNIVSQTGTPPTELNIRITTVWTIGSSKFSSAFNTLFTNWRVN